MHRDPTAYSEVTDCVVAIHSTPITISVPDTVHPQYFIHSGIIMELISLNLSAYVGILYMGRYASNLLMLGALVLIVTD